MTKFITNQNVEINLELASLGDRILAFIVDAAIIGTYIFMITIFFAPLISGGNYVVLIVLGLPVLFYSLLFETLSNGQSPGKKVREIKVVKLDGGEPGIGNYLLRWILRPIDITLYGAVAMLCIIITRNGQRLGDLAAGTTVIKIRRSVSITDIQTVKSEDKEHEVTFPQVRRLSDQQIELIRRSLNMRKKGFNQEAVAELAKKIKDVLEVKSDLSDVKFLYTIIRDYQHLVEE